MKHKPLQAPVIPYSIALGTTGTPAQQIFEGSGTIDVVMCALGTTAGVRFGDSDNLQATAATSFPITTEWVRIPITRASCFISALSLTGTGGFLYYYFPGQTDPDV